jgi:hypothetical protein
MRTLAEAVDSNRLRRTLNLLGLSAALKRILGLAKSSNLAPQTGAITNLRYGPMP